AILLVAIGFPIALILSWAFDLTPEGVVSDQGSGVTVQRSGRRMEYVFAGLLVVAVGTLLYREFSPSEQVVEAVAEQSEQERLPNSVAVLPFTNLSTDPEEAFFAAGIHDTVLHELAKIRALNVIGRTSVLQYADGQTPIAEIAEALNVETVLEATVQYADDQVRITAQLIDPDTGAHLWSGNYDRPFKDIFSIQSEIATRIAMALEAELSPAERASIEQAPTNSPEAWAFYLKALELFPGVEQAGIPRAEEEAALAFLEQATQIDPEFALAYAHMAKIGWRGIEIRRAQIDQALALDPELGFGYLVLGLLHRSEGNATDAQTAFERALQWSPNDPDALTEYAGRKWAIGETQNAMTLVERALVLDPNSWSTYFSVGNFQLWARETAAAAMAFRRVTELSPTNLAGHLQLGLTEAALGNFSEAAEQFQLVEQLTNLEFSFHNALLAYGYSRIGRTEDAGRLFGEYQRARTTEEYSPRTRLSLEVWTSLAVGDNQAALDLLQELAEESGIGGNIETFKSNAFDDPILDQPEFVEVRRRLGFRE
ncbi:MAG: tetratricopeptide repeat protein, partial [Gammaproteobacteria bacterium]|nr:tetratricopeptide repeat protein [Gammaproteobacteria bacterium]